MSTESTTDIARVGSGPWLGVRCPNCDRLTTGGLFGHSNEPKDWQEAKWIVTHCGCYHEPRGGERFTADRDSAWEQSGAVMAEADKLEELVQLKLENPGMTREAALEWALEMRRLYSPNGADQRRGHLGADTQRG